MLISPSHEISALTAALAPLSSSLLLTAPSLILPRNEPGTPLSTAASSSPGKPREFLPVRCLHSSLSFSLFYFIIFFFVSPALRLFNTLLPQRISLRCFPRATSRAVSAGLGKPCWRGAAKPGTSPPCRPDPVQRSGLNHPRRPGKPGQAAWRLASPKSLPETRGKSCWSRGAVSRQWRRSGHRPWGAHPKILPAFLQSHEKQGSAFQLCSFPPHHRAVGAATPGGKKMRLQPGQN